MGAGLTTTDEDGGTFAGKSELGLREKVAVRIESAPMRGLVLVEAHRVVVHLVVAVVFFALANAVIFVLVGSPPNPTEGLLLEVIIVLAATAVPVSLRAIALRRQFGAISLILAKGPAGATPILARFISEELDELSARIAGVRSVGQEFVDTDVASWIRRRCFLVTTGRYMGADECVPSVFMELYRGYLVAQSEYLERTRSTSSIRINVADGEALTQDRVTNPDAWNEYLHWHALENVELLHCERDTALRLSRETGLNSVIDVACWEGEMAVLVTYTPNKRQTLLRVCFAGEPLFGRAQEFIHAVSNKSCSQPFPRAGLSDPKA